MKTDEMQKKLVTTSFADLMQNIVNYQPQNLFEITANRGSSTSSSSLNYSIEQARTIIATGTTKQKRDLSNYMFRMSGIYRRAIITAATMPLYYSELVPLMADNLKDNQFQKSYFSSLTYLQNSDFQQDLIRVFFYLFKDGRYYGILRKKDGVDGVFIYDLPVDYCRVRNKDMFNRWIIEFDLSYFDNIKVLSGEDKNLMKKVILEGMPADIQEAYFAYKNRKIGKWITLDSEQTVCLVSFDGDPVLISSIPDAINLVEAKDNNKQLDSMNLRKLLISKLPVTSEGELVFDLDEANEIHSATAKILKNTPYIDLLTTFGDTSMVNLEAKEGVQNDKLVKVERSLYNELGMSSGLYNSDGNTAMTYSIENLQAMIFSYFPEIEHCFSLHFSQEFGKSKKLTYSFKLLRITEFNKKDFVAEQKDLATFGFPTKITTMIANGFSQLEMLSKLRLENDFLDLVTLMVPLSSSYTQSGSAEVGAPEQDPKAKSTKTNQNINAGGENVE